MCLDVAGCLAHVNILVLIFDASRAFGTLVPCDEIEFGVCRACDFSLKRMNSKFNTISRGACACEKQNTSIFLHYLVFDRKRARIGSGSRTTTANEMKLDEKMKTFQKIWDASGDRECEREGEGERKQKEQRGKEGDRERGGMRVEGTAGERAWTGNNGERADGIDVERAKERRKL